MRLVVDAGPVDLRTRGPTRPPVTAMRAPAGPHAHHRVGLVGDLSVRPTRSRASSASRTHEPLLRRTTTTPSRRAGGGAKQLVIVTAVADPVARRASSTGAWSRRTRAGSEPPVLCLTKADLGDPEFGAVPRAGDAVVDDRRDQPPPTRSRNCWRDGSRRWSRALASPRWSTGWSDAARATGVVSAVRKGAATASRRSPCLPRRRSRSAGADRRAGRVPPATTYRRWSTTSRAVSRTPARVRDGLSVPRPRKRVALDVLVAEGKLRPARSAALRRSRSPEGRASSPPRAGRRDR